MKTPAGPRHWMAVGALASLAGTWATPASATDADHCHKLYRLTDVSHAIEPGIPVPATDALPAHCRVRGVINRAIRFEVTLPDAWSGRMMFTAAGGGAGYIADTTSLLDRGFAMASTDAGHEIEEGNEYLRQPEAALDYAYRGVHLATVAAKRVIAHYYGRPIDHAYLTGCSNGGRAAVLEAERFPEDYDGIIAGAPLFRFAEFVPWMVAAHDLHAAHPLTMDALTVLDDASREACDAQDGVADGVINDPRTCTVDLDALACAADADPASCLTPGQIETARFLYGNLLDEDGNVIARGVPPGAESAGDWGGWLHGLVPAPDSVGEQVRHMLGIMMRHDPSFDASEFDPARDHARIADAMAPYDTTGDLSEFRARGGKLLMYQGWNDFPLTPGRALDYLAGVEAAMGGADATAGFFRLFMVPGMVHCGGGPGAWRTDYVDPIVKWTEQGEAPERIVATHPGEPMSFAHLRPSREPVPSRPFTRPLCVYPKLAQYDGEGDPDDESSFRCAAP